MGFIKNEIDKFMQSLAVKINKRLNNKKIPFEIIRCEKSKLIFTIPKN